MTAQEIAEALCAEIPCGPRMKVGLAAGDYAAVIVDRIDHAVQDQHTVTAGLLSAIHTMIEDDDVFDDEQILSLRRDLPVLLH